MPKTTFVYKNPDALDVTKKMNDAREIFVEQHQLVDLKIEMDTPEGFSKFNQLPTHVLPPLPAGYRWVDANEKYSIIQEDDAKSHDLSLIIYGPDKKTKKINFLFRVDGKTTYSFAHTKNGSGPSNRNYPHSPTDFKVPRFSYKGHDFKQHVRGHLIDHQDTIINAAGQDSWSTLDPRNYVPEPPDREWGMNFRRLEIARLRKLKGGAAYAQINQYPQMPLFTVNSIAVPEDVKLIPYTISGTGYKVDGAFNVEFSEDLIRPHAQKVLDYAKSYFGIDAAACPVVVPYSPDHSDRTLRKQSRDAQKKAKEILDGTIEARFPRRDSLNARIDAADTEFETAGRRLKAAVSAYRQGDKALGKTYANRSLFFGEKLSELDEGSPYKKSDKKTAEFYYKKTGDEEFIDHFRQLSTK